MTSRVMKVLLLFGTRPEAIKLFPVIKRLRGEPSIETILCVTAQQRDLLDQTLSVLSLIPDYDLDVMIPHQSLFHTTSTIISRIEPVLRKVHPGLVIVQGDAQTTFCGALSAYYARIPVAHVEAGLRTGDKFSPYPEEMNRRLVDQIADLHFAPTAHARENLISEGIPEESVFVTGNTEIDTLYYVRDLLRSTTTFDFPGHIVIVTMHRRESFSAGIDHVCTALSAIANRNRDVSIVVPVHPNPHVQEQIRRALTGVPRIILLDPIDYVSFVHLLARASLILTDSGGLQESAVGLHVPLLVLRDKTERTEGIDAGAAILVGTNAERIVGQTERLLRDDDARTTMAGAKNPYGDGHAADLIVDIIKERFT